MKLKTLIFTAMLALAGSAFAATPPPSGSTGTGAHMGPCKTDPAKCQAAAAKFDNWCQANAEKCTDLKAWAEKRIEYCQTHGQECKEHREKMHQHMHRWCDNNPDNDHCQKMKARMQGDEPGQGDEPSDDQAPPPPPSM